ncbi:Lrp/AsnC family transcriptional regulator [Candidatus Woesearchaeota archaeon]|nr:Lrp/AsnC family transcriptional regulator [Candidatus Woesearchaeota archaeon]
MVEKNELIILSRLRENGRESLTNMSRKTYIPVTTLHKKLKGFEGEVIKKYVALLDFTRLGFNTRANIVIKVKKELRDQLRDFLIDNKAINSLYRINNGFDFLIEVVFKEIKDVEFFVEQLENNFKIEKKEIYYIIEELRKEEFLGRYEYVKLTGSLS